MSSFFTFRLRSATATCGAGMVVAAAGGDRANRCIMARCCPHRLKVTISVRIDLLVLLFVLCGYAGSCWSPLHRLLAMAATTATAAIVIVLILSPAWTSTAAQPTAFFGTPWPQLSASVSLSSASSFGLPSGPLAPAVVTATELLTSISSVLSGSLSRQIHVLVLRCRLGWRAAPPLALSLLDGFVDVPAQIGTILSRRSAAWTALRFVPQDQVSWSHSLSCLRLSCFAASRLGGQPC
jgi:hypothetical protein